MKIIGLTGGIACGKSTVVSSLRRAGLPVIDMDSVAHRVHTDAAVRRRIVAAFGAGVLGADGETDRKKLGDVIFSDDDKRRTLNRIMQAPLARALFRAVLWHFAVGTPVVVLDAPLLFEVKALRSICAKVLVVHVSADVQIERLMARDKDGQADAERRIAAQMPLAQKVAMADIVVDNDGSEEALRARVEALAVDIQAFSWHRLVGGPTLLAVVVLALSGLLWLSWQSTAAKL